MLQSGYIAIFPKEVTIPIVPLFAEWDKITESADSAKSGTIGILTYPGKIAVSPDCNIQLG